MEDEERIMKAMRERMIAEDEGLEGALQITPDRFSQYVEITRKEYLQLLEPFVNDMEELWETMRMVKDLVSAGGRKGGYFKTAFDGAMDYEDCEQVEANTLKTYVDILDQTFETCAEIVGAIQAGTDDAFRYFRDGDGNPRAMSQEVLDGIDRLKEMREKIKENKEIYI